MSRISEIAEQNNLQVINVGFHGISENQALVGFDTLAQAEKIADKEKMELRVFVKKNGTSVYEPTNNKPYEEFDILAHYEQYAIFRNTDVNDFQEIDIDETLENKDFSSEAEKQTWLKKMYEIKERIASLADNEFIYLDSNGYSEALRCRDTAAEVDGNYYVIGLE